MLVSDVRIYYVDPILRMLAAMDGRNGDPKEIAPGIYEIGHFGSSDWPYGYERYPDLGANFGCYGVCDNAQQVLDRYAVLRDPDRKFILTLTPVISANQSPEGGWRWHKWGEYIGAHEIQCEYLYDETGIDKVYVYHIYEKI